MFKKRLIAAALALVVALGVSGCAGGSDKFSEGVYSDATWRADFDLQLKYEVNDGTQFVGYVTDRVEAGVRFTVNELGQLEMAMPKGIANLTVSDDISVCDASTSMGNEVVMLIEKINGRIQGNEIVFANDFIAPEQNEGRKMTCHGYPWDEPNESMIKWIGEQAFPVSIEFNNNAKVLIQHPFTFSGRQATITGTIELHRE